MNILVNTPLIDSDWGYAEASERLIAHKRYER